MIGLMTSLIVGLNAYYYADDCARWAWLSACAESVVSVASKEARFANLSEFGTDPYAAYDSALWVGARPVPGVGLDCGGRVGVWSETLTADSLIAAIRRGATWGYTGNQIALSLECNGEPQGSTVSGGRLSFRLQAVGNASYRRAEIVTDYGWPVLSVDYAPSVSRIDWQPSIDTDSGQSTYCYARVYYTQGNDTTGRAWSAPIWVRPTPPDVGVTALRGIPTIGTTDSGRVMVAPGCSVRNYGARAETYSVRLKAIRRGATWYSKTAAVADHAPGTVRYVTFPACTMAVNGQMAFRASTELVPDAAPKNNSLTWEVTVRPPDIGVVAIVSPRDTEYLGASVVPACSVYNAGGLDGRSVSYSVQARLGSYNKTVMVTGHAPLTTLFVTFPTYTAVTPGEFALSCSTMMATDARPANNKRVKAFVQRAQP